MKIEITGVNMSVSDRLREEVESQLSKFHRFFGDEAVTTVKVQPEQKDVKVEITLKIRRDIYRVEATAPEAKVALDAAIDNMERQIRKHKSKLKKRKHDLSYMDDYLDQLPALTEEEIQEASPEITRRKRFVIDAMDSEEAALQMELIDHDFFLYLSPKTGKVCVLYKRHDGDYGILEPEY